jgi:hypothetical protein
MSKDNKSQMITIDEVEYDTADFTEEQIVLTNHCLRFRQEDWEYELSASTTTSRQRFIFEDVKRVSGDCRRVG